MVCDQELKQNLYLKMQNIRCLLKNIIPSVTGPVCVQELDFIVP